MKLKQAGPSGGAIRLVPMIDVLMIMLIFFMVTSTYLNLQMIPLAERAEAPGTGSGADPAPPATADGRSGTLLIRIDSAGQVLVRGRPLAPDALSDLLRERLAVDPALGVVLLPSGRASTQALVSLLDTTTSAGVRRLRLVRLGEGP